MKFVHYAGNKQCNNNILIWNRFLKCCFYEWYNRNVWGYVFMIFSSASVLKNAWAYDLVFRTPWALTKHISIRAFELLQTDIRWFANAESVIMLSWAVAPLRIAARSPYEIINIYNITWLHHFPYCIFERHKI